LYLEDGQAYKGKGFGAAATKVGELIFNTAMIGYQELLTDPAVKGQIINMTYPLIGNYGISDIDNESEHIQAFGLVTHDITFRPSGRHGIMNISEWLRYHSIPGVYNVDTRAIAKKIRSEGIMKCLISTEGISKDNARELIENTALRTDYMRDAGVRQLTALPGLAAEGAPGRGLKIAVIDFGVKQSVLRELRGRGCDLLLCPYGVTAEEILGMNADGLLLPDGPGDPAECKLGIEATSYLIGRLPILGIGLGHLVFALAAGGSVYKLRYGHHGANHGVIDLDAGKSFIASQGHNYAVDAESLRDSGLAVTHVNLNDGTVEGMRYMNLPVFSVQFNPEGSPGPNDTKWVFDRFLQMALDMKSGNRMGGNRDAKA